jgi:hypothetical protein
MLQINEYVSCFSISAQCHEDGLEAKLCTFLTYILNDEWFTVQSHRTRDTCCVKYHVMRHSGESAAKPHTFLTSASAENSSSGKREQPPLERRVDESVPVWI